MPAPSLQSIKMLDIAERLNLSVATVSRALRKVPGINPQTRARVMQAASEFGYRLPLTYREQNEDNGQLHHVGILLETSKNSVPHPYLTGMSEASMSLNASLVIHYVKPGECESILDSRMQPMAMRSGLISGLILVFWWPREIVKTLSEQFPTVSIMHKYAGLDVDTVGIENEGGMELLVKKLHAQGHQNIAFLGRCSQLHWANARFGGYVAALSALNLNFRPEWVVDANFETLTNLDASWSYIGERIEKVMSQGVTAWVSASEPAGWYLQNALTERGYKIPQDVSITGFHRPIDDPIQTSSLTSVVSSYEAIGAAALKRLCLKIRNPAESSRTIAFPCEYYPGSTIGPAPSR